ncbi:hypothetical protein ACP4OV_024732 [Aristida adscensionis]
MGTRLMRGLSLGRLAAQQRSSAENMEHGTPLSLSLMWMRRMTWVAKEMTILQAPGKIHSSVACTGYLTIKHTSGEIIRYLVWVHSCQAIICGKVGQAPVQKILNNGHTVTVFTVGTGGMFDQRVASSENLPVPAQWHRIAVHNEQLGAYAVQKLVKNASVYVEGDIETRVYNDRINGQAKNIPEICVRRDGKVNLIQSGESDVSKSLDALTSGRDYSSCNVEQYWLDNKELGLDK